MAKFLCPIGDRNNGVPLHVTGYCKLILYDTGGRLHVHWDVISVISESIVYRKLLSIF